MVLQEFLGMIFSFLSKMSFLVKPQIFGFFAENPERGKRWALPLIITKQAGIGMIHAHVKVIPLTNMDRCRYMFCSQLLNTEFVLCPAVYKLFYSNWQCKLASLYSDNQWIGRITWPWR